MGTGSGFLWDSKGEPPFRTPSPRAHIRLPPPLLALFVLTAPKIIASLLFNTEIAHVFVRTLSHSPRSQGT